MEKTFFRRKKRSDIRTRMQKGRICAGERMADSRIQVRIGHGCRHRKMSGCTGLSLLSRRFLTEIGQSLLSRRFLLMRFIAAESMFRRYIIIC